MLDKRQIQGEDRGLAGESLFNRVNQSLYPKAQSAPEGSDHEHIGEKLVATELLWRGIFGDEDGREMLLTYALIEVPGFLMFFITIDQESLLPDVRRRVFRSHAVKGDDDIGKF